MCANTSLRSLSCQNDSCGAPSRSAVCFCKSKYWPSPQPSSASVTTLALSKTLSMTWMDEHVSLNTKPALTVTLAVIVRMFACAVSFPVPPAGLTPGMRTRSQPLNAPPSTTTSGVIVTSVPPR